MTYADFDLLVDRCATGFRAQVLGSPAGTGSHEFRLPFSDIEIENLLLRVGRRRPVVRRAESSSLRAAKSFGAALFKAVFGGEVDACFHRSVAECKVDDPDALALQSKIRAAEERKELRPRVAERDPPASAKHAPNGNVPKTTDSPRPHEELRGKPDPSEADYEKDLLD